MAPSKFGLFKSRSKEQSDQPSVENLLQSSNSIDRASSPQGIMSTELALAEMAAQMRLDNVDEKHSTPVRRASESGKHDSVAIGYKQLKNQLSTEMTSTSTLQDNDTNQTQQNEEVNDDLTSTRPADQVDDQDDASTSCDANSIQFDELSIAPSEDLSVYCGGLKKPKKSRSKEEEQIIKDYDMWHASNVEVMQNLLNKRGTLDDQIKWQAIATARGLCTLTDSCTCPDCRRVKFLAGMADGDGGLASAPLFNAVSVGCSLQ